MQRIAHSSTFIPCENQRIITSKGVLVVNRYECFMENKNIKRFCGYKLSEKATSNLIKILLDEKRGDSGLTSRHTEYQK